MTRKRGITISQARFYLFNIWVGAFLIYVFAFLSTSLKDGVTFDQASHASWNIAYVLLPIITSFGSFWFGPQSDLDKQHGKKEMDGSRAYAVFSITALFHIVLLGFFSFAIFAVDFKNPSSPDVSFTDRVDAGMKWLLLLSSAAVLPVGFVLGGKGPSNLELPNARSSDQKQ
jgi:hypothetical protein